HRDGRRRPRHTPLPAAHPGGQRAALTPLRATPLQQGMGTRQQPVPPPSWWDAPAFVAGGAEFARLDLTAVRFVLEHWVWARTHSTMWGPGLVAHHNWLKFCVAEDAA